MQKNIPQKCKKIYPNQTKNKNKKQNDSSLLTKLKEKDRTIINTQNEIWNKFILWSKDKLSSSSNKKLGEVEIRIEKKDVYIKKSSISRNLETIIKKFFIQKEKCKIEFLDEKEWTEKKSLF